MKRLHLYFLLTVTLLVRTGFCIDQPDSLNSLDRLKKDPGIYLNFQDVPLFYTGSPLRGLFAFAVLPPYSIQNQEVSKKIQLLIEKELGSIGTIIKAKTENVSGFARGNILQIQVGSVSKWEGGELPISRVTLSIEAPAMIGNISSLPRVWAINDFVDAPFNIESEKKMVGAVQKLLKEFSNNYKFANPHPVQKPLFYLY